MGDVPLHFEATYPKLHAFAEKLFRRQPSTSTLQATALVHEVYLRFARLDPSNIKDHEHFMALAAGAMHQILTDKARRRNAGKRGGGSTPITLSHVMVSPSGGDDLRKARDFDRGERDRPGHCDPQVLVIARCYLARRAAVTRIVGPRFRKIASTGRAPAG